MTSINDYGRLWTLISKKLAAEASEKEMAELEELQMNIPGARNLVEVLSNWRQVDQSSVPAQQPNNRCSI